MSSAPCDWIAFDYGGTLAPVSPPVTAVALANTVRRHAVRPPPAYLEQALEAALEHARVEARRVAMEHPLVETLATVLAQLEASVSRPIDELVDESFESIGDGAPYPDVQGMVSRLRAAGYSCVIAANSLRTSGVRRATLRAAGLEGFFQHLLLSSEVGLRKPHPRFYEELLYRIGANADRVAFVGDTFRNDVEGPVAAGMRAVWIRRDAQRVNRWIDAEGCVAEVSSLREAQDVLLDWRTHR